MKTTTTMMMICKFWEWLRIFGAESDDSIPPTLLCDETPPPSMPLLCDDVLNEILLQVPPDVLSRFKCVSRQSYRLINDPEFLRRYRSKLSVRPCPLAGLFYQYQHQHQQRSLVGFANVELDGKDTKARGVQCIDKTLSFLPNPATILASQQGLLLCISTKRNPARYYVCNPITKQCALLPKSKRPFDSFSTGFFVDRKYGHYQIIRIPHIAQGNTLTLVETFSSQTGRWRLLRLEVPSHYWLRLPDWPAVQWNRSLHWVVGPRSILAYNVTEEQFRFLEMPSGYGVLGVSSGRLSFASCDKDLLQVTLRSCNGWLALWKVSMRTLVSNNSEVLRRLRNLKSEKEAGRSLSFSPVFLDESDPRVIFLWLPGWIVSYNFDKFKIQPIQQLSKEQKLEDVFPYVIPQLPFTVVFHGLNTPQPSMKPLPW